MHQNEASSKDLGILNRAQREVYFYLLNNYQSFDGPYRVSAIDILNPPVDYSPFLLINVLYDLNCIRGLILCDDPQFQPSELLHDVLSEIVHYWENGRLRDKNYLVKFKVAKTLKHFPTTGEME